MDTTKRDYKSWVLIAVILLLFGTAVASTQYKVPVIMPGIMERFSMDASSASWLMSIFTFVGIILAIPTGVLAKRFGPRTMLLCAAAVVAIGSVMGAFAGNGTMLIVSRGIEGIAFIFVTICGPLAVQRYVAPEKIGSATGIWALWVCLGSVVGGTLTPSLYTATGFVGVWVFYAAAAVVFAIIVAVVVKLPTGLGNVDESGADVPTTETQPASYGEFLKPNILLFFLGFLIFNMVLLFVLAFSPSWMQAQGIDPTLSGFISTLPMLLAVISSPLFGAVSDRIGRCKPLYVIGMLSMGPCALLLLTGSGVSLWIGAILMGLIGLGVPVMCLTSYITVLGRPELMSIGMGVLMLVQSLGQFLGTFLAPLILGPGLDQWMTFGITALICGLLGTVVIAVCKFR